MSNFLDALPFVLANEGWYSNVSGDTGGETFRGISRNNFPQWPGWAIVDAHREDALFPNSLRVIPALTTLVEQFYETTFWEPMQAASISFQDLATRYFDTGVNCGPHEAVKLLQRAVNVMRDDYGQPSIPVDGIVGPQTLGAVEALNGPQLLAEFKQERRNLYYEIVAAHPADKKFLSDWLSRADL